MGGKSLLTPMFNDIKDEYEAMKLQLCIGFSKSEIEKNDYNMFQLRKIILKFGILQPENEIWFDVI